ncbi:MAG TPA: GAF domain-containing protein [Gemmatimonadales bacterium]|nr:GAF domain-containing protein [Gemmatimonadales bacterium]
MNTLTPVPIAVERRVAELEAANIQLTERALGAEQKLARAAQLFASVSELHSSNDPADVVTVIKEIVANLLGCEEMGVFEVWPLGPVFTYIDGIGIDADKFATLPPSHPLVQQAFTTSQVVVPADPTAESILGRPAAAIVPLRDGATVCGIVVLFTLLRQKPVLEREDAELLDAVATHGGRALINARLRERTR